MECKYCKATEKQVKNGKNPSGSQRWFCQICQRVYTPKANAIGASPERKKQAIRLYLEGLSFRAIGRLLAVHHQTVINWIQAHADDLPDPPLSAEEIQVVELDELYTFVGKKSPVDTGSMS